MGLLGIAALSVSAIYGIILFIAWFRFALTPQRKNDEIREAEIAVVVAARNEGENISRLLQGLSEQDYPFRFDVIIVDDHSDDNGKTQTALRTFTSERFNLRVLQAHGHGKKAALTQGIAFTNAEYILVTDGDCIPGKSWVRTFVALLADEETSFAAGLVTYSGKGILRNTLQTEMMFLQVVSSGLSVMCNGASMAFTKKFFESVDGFSGSDYASGDDVLLLSKARQKGSKIKWNNDPSAMVITLPASRTAQAIVQRKRWLSKSKGYGFGLLALAGLVFFLAQLLLPAALIYSCITGSVASSLVYALAVKTVVELLLLSLTAPRFGEYKVIPAFPLTVILYDVIALGAAFSLLRSDITWKGRTWKQGKMA